MGKVIFWIVVVFVALFGLRLVNAAKAKRRAGPAARGPARVPVAEPMVRCLRCGVFLPRADATPVSGGYTCGDARCVPRP
jgi:hypothetical protein